MWLFLLAEDTPPEPTFWQQLLGSPISLLVMMVVLFYFVLLRPGQQQEKLRRAKVAALKKNDKIINSGGIIGIVESIKDDEIVLRGGLRLTKSSIVQVLKEEAAKEQ
jgi:preprotein translocase subunit YajC